MARWLCKRWVWAALAGATMTIGIASGQPPHKVGDVISLNFQGQGERKFKVLKVERQPDGTTLSEVKDTKTGETITLLDKPEDVQPLPSPMKAFEPAKSSDSPKEMPKAKRPNDAPAPGATPMSDPPKDEKKRPVLNRIFGEKNPSPAPSMPAAGPTTANAPPRMDAAPEPPRKSLISRVFGPKKSPAPSMPAASQPPAVGPVAKPPAVIPLPPSGLSGSPGTPQLFPPGTLPGSTAEPPRVMPPRSGSTPPAPLPTPMPVTPTPSFPTPAPLPTPMPVTPPAVSSPVPAPLPALPTPTPTIPAPPTGGLPTIPIPPGGTSSLMPIQVVIPAGYIPPSVAFDRDVQPFVIALQTMHAPSARLTAAKGLAEGRHCSTDGVKNVLFQAARMDPCGEVRAACIEYLCKLGYFHPQFLGYIQAACEDADPQVRDAAKAAVGKMMRK